jgi:hypothetical protein
MPDTTVKKLPAHLNPECQFKPGQSGNPRGRPKGSRNKLGEIFLAALLGDFEEHGVEAIARVRDEQPAQYLKIIASILSRELDVTENELDDLTEEQLIERLRELDAMIRPLIDGEDGPNHYQVATQPLQGYPLNAKAIPQRSE